MVIPLWIFWKKVYLIILPLLFLLQSMLAIGLNLLSFFYFWAEHAQFLDWVDEGWKIEVTGYAMFRMYSMLNL
jgi:hypothetical protein